MNDFGIGTDIEDISRFRKYGHSRNDPFLNKIYTKSELDYCFSKKNPLPHLAARFSGKEAVIKALRHVSEVLVNYKEIEILNNSNGTPHVTIKNNRLLNICVIISLSHTKKLALAFALVKKLIPKR